MEIRLSGHSAYRTEYHIVWISKYRCRILNPGLRGYLRKLFPKITRSLPGCEIIEYNIQIDLILPRDGVVEVAGRWGEDYYSYPGRSDISICQKSVKAILTGNTGKGLNMVSSRNIL